MRRLILLGVLLVLAFSLGCKKDEPEPRKLPPRRLFKPGEGQPVPPGGNPAP